MSTFNAVLARNAAGLSTADRQAAHSVAFSHYNNLSAQLPLDRTTGQLVAGGIRQQAEQCFENIRSIVESIYHSMDDVVRITIFLRDIADLATVNAVYATFFPVYVPALTAVAVHDLPLGALLQVEALLSNGEGTIPNAPQAGDLIKLARNTDSAPCSALSTQTVAFSHYNNLTAQLPVNPHTGVLVEGGIEEQAAQCLRNIKAILNSIDVPFDDIVKINLYLTDLADLPAVDAVYSTFFPDSAIARSHAYFPARSVIPAQALPLAARIQIEAVVSHGDGTPPQAVEDRHGIVIRTGRSADVPQDKLATQSVAFSHYNHISALLPVSAHDGKVVAGGIAAQTRQCLEHLQNITQSIEHSLADVVKVNICLTRLADLPLVDAVYRDYFPSATPARRIIGVASLPAGADIQIDAVLANAEGTAPRN
ncbi:RidA family protein [Aquitalea sp. USM4]|uniref:RidA family protein n=1 Tax=Aquitalea sp. USM4 TaxID=1590041 RepID=UPI00103C5ABC|nr:RidA family protein [Aquitalea sp. USM4]QBJ79557.1 reactive intermediate/imine deaminase [Aquitalea sp. USM4]